MNHGYFMEFCLKCDFVQHRKYRIDLRQIAQSITQQHAAQVQSIHRTVCCDTYFKACYDQ